MLATLPAFGQLVLVGGCSATAATSCTPATVGGHSFASGQFIYTFAFRTATTAPTLSSSPTFTALDTASASTSSFRSGCAVSTSSSPSSGTWANATRVVTLIYSGSPATTTANCASSGVGGKTTAGTSGTTSTITYTGITLTHGDGSSWVIGAAGGSAAVCTPATILHSEESATDLVGNDTNGGVTSFSTLTCTGSAGNWKSDTVELLSTTLATPTYTPDAGGFTTVGGVYVTIGLAGGATGCYTTDNSTPTASPDGTCSHGSTYSAPVLISTSGTVLQAIATESGFVNSAVKNSTFTLQTPFSMLSLMGTGIGGFAGSLSLPIGWQVVQDNIDGADCSGSSTSCTDSKIAPTLSGSLWIACGAPAADDTISSITGGSGTWHSMANAHVVALGATILDCQENTTGTAGTASLSMTMTSQNLFAIFFVEALPPSGYSASFDVAGNSAPTSCASCDGPSLNLAATDLVVTVWGQANSPVLNSGFSVFAAPFFTGLSGDGFATNVSGTVQPTANQSPAGAAGFIAMAFKSTAGTFTVPAPLFTIVNVTSVHAGSTCSPVCPAITLNGTPAAGDLLFVQAADLQSGGYISSINDGHSGTFTIPSPGSTCAVQVVNNVSGFWNQSCAWETLPSGVTQITPTMGASGATGFLIYQAHRTSGAWTLDAQNSTTNSSPSGSPATCPSLTITGTNELIFQGGANGGQLWVGSPNYYVQPYIENSSGFGTAVLDGNASGAVGLNMTQYYQCGWMGVQTGAGNPFALYAVAFK